MRTTIKKNVKTKYQLFWDWNNRNRKTFQKRSHYKKREKLLLAPVSGSYIYCPVEECVKFHGMVSCRQSYMQANICVINFIFFSFTIVVCQGWGRGVHLTAQLQTGASYSHILLSQSFHLLPPWTSYVFLKSKAITHILTRHFVNKIFNRMFHNKGRFHR